MKVLKTRTYHIEHNDIIDDNGERKIYMRRTCDGFSPLELLGILEKTQLEILDQMAGRIKPDLIERQVTKETLDEIHGDVPNKE